jgi:peptide/nickel transport system substrate-binding protein
MRAISARRRSTVVASAAALFLGTALVSGVGPANAATTPKTGGILTLLEHEPRLDHLDPSRIYTGRDLAFMNSFHTRTLVAYNPVQAMKQRPGSSHFVQVQRLKMA